MCVAVGSFSLWDCGASRWAAHAILAGPGLQLMVSGPALRTAISNGSPCCSTHLFGNKMWHVLKEQCGFFNLSPEKTIMQTVLSSAFSTSCHPVPCPLTSSSATCMQAETMNNVSQWGSFWASFCVLFPQHQQQPPTNWHRLQITQFKQIT